VIAAVLVALAAPAGYTLSTVRTAHNGAIPTAGPRGAGGFGFPGGRAFGGAGGAGGFASPPNGAAGGAGPGGGPGGLLNGSTSSPELTKALETNASRYTWVAATVGANSAAGYQLATGDPVMAIGGFNGTDPSPTLAQFERWVREGKIHYFIASGGGFGGPGGFGGRGAGSATAQQIRSWVESNFSTTTIGGVTLYDLTSPSS
jgi:hypothetical protein